ncbi:hypothetical protein [Streptomyces sp. NPDC049879]|uniref:hypothetical protein n=1 Tax=Streptomyces sp. NPDC049879 TaxID=3365598 RepID=UPI003797D117
MHLPARLRSAAEYVYGRLTGREIALVHPDGVREQLDIAAARLRRENRFRYANGAAELPDALAYQPGLMDAHAAAFDMTLYLDALSHTAEADCHDQLAAHLTRAAAAAHALTTALATAAIATTDHDQEDHHMTAAADDYARRQSDFAEMINDYEAADHADYLETMAELDASDAARAARDDD